MEIERTKERKTFTTRIKTNKKVILLTMIWEVKKERKKKKRCLLMMMKLEEIAKRRRKGKHTPFRNKSDTKFLLIFLV